MTKLCNLGLLVVAILGASAVAFALQARECKPDPVKSDERVEVPRKTAGKLVLEFVRVPKGKFLMGSPAGERADLKKRYDWNIEREDEHEVEITRDYLLGKTTVTRGQFRAFVDDDGYKTEAEQDGKGGYGWNGKAWEQKPEYTWTNPGFEQTDEHPVVEVSWNDAQAFCAWVKRKTGKAVRLPSEAEWERACRGGERKGRYFFGDDEEDLLRYANVPDASFRAATKKDWGIKADDGHAFTAPVGKFRANQYGLYDMHGNVAQWCEDYFDAKFYANSPAKDPVNTNKTDPEWRVVRGGSWYEHPKFCRAAHRSHFGQAKRSLDTGFRLALSCD